MSSLRWSEQPGLTAGAVSGQEASGGMGRIGPGVHVVVIGGALALAADKAIEDVLHQVFLTRDPSYGGFVPLAKAATGGVEYHELEDSEL